MNESEILALLDGLDDREKKIIFQRFGLGGRKPQTLYYVGKKFGISRERVRQLQNIAVRKLQRLGRFEQFYSAVIEANNCPK